MSDKASASASGIGFMGLLAILFIALKLTGFITWSWWWVLMPLWVCWVLVVIFLLVVFAWAVVKR